MQSSMVICIGACYVLLTLLSLLIRLHCSRVGEHVLLVECVGRSLALHQVVDFVGGAGIRLERALCNELVNQNVRRRCCLMCLLVLSLELLVPLVTASTVSGGNDCRELS